MREDEHFDFLKEVGQRVRIIRKEKNLTMENLAYETGMECRQIGRIERGEINTSLLSMKRIAIALDVDLHLFFTS